ncbi:GAG-pre-integrase domain [Arabidopsis suecica]|uniref:GAG-pre-integrase domain n=1 Tax=Arabidopsis suecica TaxID=45249 RepID=A0A8T1XEK6_ARASU|nr:GAG-pre-integrase domain [Arabidopsis suecica]
MSFGGTESLRVTVYNFSASEISTGNLFTNANKATNAMSRVRYATQAPDPIIERNIAREVTEKDRCAKDTHETGSLVSLPADIHFPSKDGCQEHPQKFKAARCRCPWATLTPCSTRDSLGGSMLSNEARPSNLGGWNRCPWGHLGISGAFRIYRHPRPRRIHVSPCHDTPILFGDGVKRCPWGHLGIPCAFPIYRHPKASKNPCHPTHDTPILRDHSAIFVRELLKKLKNCDKTDRRKSRRKNFPAIIPAVGRSDSLSVMPPDNIPRSLPTCWLTIARTDRRFLVPVFISSDFHRPDRCWRCFPRTDRRFLGPVFICSDFHRPDRCWRCFPRTDRRFLGPVFISSDFHRPDRCWRRFLIAWRCELEHYLTPTRLALNENPKNPNPKNRGYYSSATLFIGDTVHRRHCSSAILFIAVTIHRRYCSSRLLFIAVTIHRRYCSSRLLFIAATVHRDYCSSPLLFIAATIHRRYCSSPLLFIAATVHRGYYSSPLLFIAATVHRRYCSSRLLFIAATVHRRYCSSPLLFVAATVHRGYYSSPLLFITILFIVGTVHAATIHRGYYSSRLLFIAVTIHRRYCSSRLLFIVDTVHRSYCSSRYCSSSTLFIAVLFAVRCSSRIRKNPKNLTTSKVIDHTAVTVVDGKDVVVATITHPAVGTTITVDVDPIPAVVEGEDDVGEGNKEFLNIIEITKGHKKVLETIPALSTGLYYAKKIDMIEANMAMNKEFIEKFTLWHDRLGHPGHSMMRKLITNSKWHTLREKRVIPKNLTCEACSQGKLIIRPSPAKVNKETLNFLERIQGDICGPIHPPCGTFRYFMVLIDASTRWSHVCLLSTRNQGFARLLAQIIRLRAHFPDFPLKTIRLDNAGEFTSQAFNDYCMSMGVSVEHPVAHVHTQNGLAESFIKRIQLIARPLLMRSKLPVAAWGHAVLHSSELIRIRPSSEHRYSPSQLLMGHEPDISHLKTFGCAVYIPIAPPHRTKMGPQRRMGIYVGFDSPTIIKYLEPTTGDLFKARYADCHFNESEFPTLGGETNKLGAIGTEVIKETIPDIEIRPAGSKVQVPYNVAWDAKLQSIKEVHWIIYMRLPEGIELKDKDKKVSRDQYCIRLNKSLYGLKQSGRMWYNRLSDYLVREGYKNDPISPCIFIKKFANEGFVIIAVYVDDLNILGTSGEIAQTVEYLKKEFEMKDLGKTKFCLGLQLEYVNNGILVHQKAYTEKVLKRFNMDQAHPLSSPMVVRSLGLDSDSFGPKKDEEEVLGPEVPYLSAIGALMRSERRFRRTDLANDTCLWEPKLLLRVGNRAAGACVASSPDSDLEAFSHNPAHGSFAPLAFQPSAMTNSHVPYWWVNNPTLGEFCFTMIGRADIEGSKSNVAMNAWLPQASYPCGNFSDTSSFKFRRSKGSIGHAFTVRIRTENQNQTSFYPFVPHEISVLVELILGHLRYLLTDVPPQPNSPPDNVLRPDRPAEASLGSKNRGCTPPPTHGSFHKVGLESSSTGSSFPADSAKPVPLAVVSLDSRQGHRIPLVRTSSELTVRRPGKALERAVPSPSPGRHAATRSRRGSSSSSPPTADGFGTGTPEPSPQSQSFSRSYGSILPTSLAYIVPSTRGCSPWRPDAVMSTTGRERHSVLRIFKGRRGRTGHHATCGALPAAGPYLRLSRFQARLALNENPKNPNPENRRYCSSRYCSRRYCSSRLLFIAATVHRGYCSSPLLFIAATVHRRYYSSPLLFIAVTVHRRYCSSRLLFIAATVNRRYCSSPLLFITVLFIVDTVHRSYCSSRYCSSSTLFIAVLFAVRCSSRIRKNPKNLTTSKVIDHTAVTVVDGKDVVVATITHPAVGTTITVDVDPIPAVVEGEDDVAHPLSSPMVVRSLGLDSDPFGPKKDEEEVLGPEVPYLQCHRSVNAAFFKAQLLQHQRPSYLETTQPVSLSSRTAISREIGRSTFYQSSSSRMTCKGMEKFEWYKFDLHRRPLRPGSRPRFYSDRRALLLIEAWLLPRRPGIGRALQRHPFSGLVDSADERFARQYRCGPPPEFPLASPRSGIVHHLSGPDRHAHTRTLLRRSRSVGGAPARDPANQLPCALRVYSPVDSHTCQTPWSVFQDGSNGEPTGRRPEHADAEARRRCRNPRRSTPRIDRRTGLLRSASDRDASPAPIRFPPDNFKHSLTLFSKSFSSLPRGTCSLSVSRPYLALDGIYRPIGAAFPNNPTRRQRLVVRQGPGTTGLSPSLAPLSRELRPGPSLRTLLQTTIRTPKTSDFQAGLFPVRSPLLRESLTLGHLQLPDRSDRQYQMDHVHHRMSGRSRRPWLGFRPTACGNTRETSFRPASAKEYRGRRFVTPRQTCPRPEGLGRNLRSKTRWFTGFCNSHQVSHFATFFIDARAEISVAESRFRLYIAAQHPRTHRLRGGECQPFVCLFLDTFRRYAKPRIRRARDRLRNRPTESGDRWFAGRSVLDRFSGLLATSRAANHPRRRDPNTSPDHSIGRSDGRQIAPPTKNGHAPPPIESRKSSQSVNPYYVWTCNSAGGTTRPIKTRSVSPTEGTSRPVHTKGGPADPSQAVSQAPSPESNPNSPSPVTTMVGHYPTIES